MATEQQQNTSTWLALKNRVFVGLWIASLVSGCCVSAHDTAATWLMNSLGASPLLLSLMATSASLPFFLFTLPAGAIADLVNRQKLFIGTYLWLAFAAGLLAICTWLHLIHPYVILTSVFFLGIGFDRSRSCPKRRTRISDHPGRRADEHGRNRWSGNRRIPSASRRPDDALFSQCSCISLRGLDDFATLS